MRRAIFFIWIVLILDPKPSAASTDWLDTYYQYRMLATVEAEHAGWNVVTVNEKQITAAINRLEELHFDPLWFAYNYALAVEVDEDGKLLNRDLEAGFYMIPQGENLARDSLSSGAETVDIPVEPRQYYLLRYSASGAGTSPMHRYNPIFPIGHTLRKSNYTVSYEPPLLPKALTEHERLFIPDVSPLRLDVGGRWVRGIQKISLHGIQIVFLARLRHPGRTHLMLYYQPMGGHHLMVPQKRRPELPGSTARLSRLASVEKHVGKTRYQLASGDDLDVWFAETTVKLTPQTPVPGNTADRITITSARNESQSFQIVLRPRTSIEFKGVKTTDLRKGSDVIPASAIDFRMVEFVPILRSSHITPARYFGSLGDPLVPLRPRRLTGLGGNTAIWVTVKTAPTTPAGTYRGTIIIDLAGRLTELSLSLEVYDFQLPEFSALNVNVGGQFFALSMDDTSNSTVLDYHGLKSKADLKRLARDYYTLMAENKFYPKNVALYSEIGMKWTPPPYGYNVDKPDNYFRLHDWDFTEFNETLAYFIDRLKVNTITIQHTNPTVCHLFKHLPGKELDGFPETAPHVTMAWQTFRERTFVAYGIREGDSSRDEAIEISRDQYDHLLVEYYRAIAKNLDEHGWLDHAFIMIDETMDQARLLHFLRVLKSDPLAARLKVGACMQGFESFHHKEKPDETQYAFNGLYDYYIPQLDENYNRWEKYLFPDYDIEPRRSKLWNYAVATSRLVIDTPGVNNRIMGLDIFNRGGSGFLVWDTIHWGRTRQRDPNPWRNPHSVWGNGAVCFFYPPSREGRSSKPDFTVTPSLRVMTFRESVDDYDYARILEDLVVRGRETRADVSAGEQVISNIGRFFYSSVHWSQNDAWYLEQRDRMARAIVQLEGAMNR